MHFVEVPLRKCFVEYRSRTSDAIQGRRQYAAKNDYGEACRKQCSGTAARRDSELPDWMNEEKCASDHENEPEVYQQGLNHVRLSIALRKRGNIASIASGDTAPTERRNHPV